MKTPQMSSKSGGKAPHCKVCGDESSGFHYGVDSCEGCKGFFRRCITQGMNHKCANEEKCDITPFTRNSCQYCRLKKCFEVGMSREASRLGRRPKRLKEVGGETSGVRTHTGNLPIAPYPSPQELYKLRMAELQKILQSNGTFKAELMQAFLSAAKASFQEHSKSNTGDVHGPTSGKGKQHPQHQKQLQIGEAAGLGNINQPGGSPIPSTSTVLDTSAPDSVGLGAGVSGLSGVDSPSSLHSPGGSMIDLSNFGAFENFLFDQGNMPATPGNQNSLDAMSELQSLNSPFNINNVSLDPVSNATSPLSDSGLASPLAALGSVSSVTNGAGMAGQEGMVGLNLNLLNTDLNVTAPSTPSPCVLQYQQSYHGYSSSYGGVQVKTEMSEGGAEVKTEPGISYSSCSVKAEMPGTSFFSSSVKTEVDPLSPESSSMSFVSPIAAFDPRQDLNKVDVAAIMEEVRQTPSQTRRVMIDQVTDAIVEAHLTTTINTSKAIGEANKRINETQTDTDDITNDLAKLKLEANNMWQRIFTAMVPEITQVVRFCKKLPGFQEIEQDDQIRLIKQGAFEVMVARCSLLVDHEKQTMLDPTLSMRTSRIVFREMPLGQFLDEFFSVAKEFNPLNLTDGEVGLFTAILIISPIRKNLANVRTVKKLQSLFQQALFYLMKHNHADPDLKFSQLMGLMPMFHRINEEHFKALNNIRINSEQGGQTVDFPELHKEVFDCST